MTHKKFSFKKCFCFLSFYTLKISMINRLKTKNNYPLILFLIWLDLFSSSIGQKKRKRSGQT